jgi:hypothetical protein
MRWLEEKHMDIIGKIAGLSRSQAQTLLARMREHEAAARGQGVPRIEPDAGRRGRPFPLTESQQACCAGRQGSPAAGNACTRGYLEIEAHGADLARLERAFNRVIARHGMLRAVVQADGCQRILADVPYYCFEVEDLSGMPAHERATRLATLRDALSHQVLPADSWPRYAIRASRLPERKLRLHLCFDMLVLDASSIGLLSADWQHYHDHPEHEPAPLAFSFADHEAGLCQMARTRAFQAALQYWRGRLDDLPPPPAFPPARSPAPAATPAVTHRSLRLPRSDWDALKKRAGALGITPAALLLSIYGSVVRRWSQSPCFTLQLAQCGRLPFHPDTARMLGNFTAATLLTFDLSMPRPFAESALGLQRQLWQDLDQRAVSGVRVLREIAARQGGAQLDTPADPPADTLPVVFTSALDDNGAGHGSDAPFEWLGRTAYAVTQTPHVRLDCQASEYGGDLAIDWNSADALFEHGAVDGMFDAFTGMLQRLARDGAAWQAPRLDLVAPAHGVPTVPATADETPVPAGVLHAQAVETWPAVSLR